MSTDLLLDSPLPEGAPELTSLGKRLEILRIERGISKQHLARFAGTSRQQLWRVMTGKSELTSSLKERLAGALSVDPSVLSAASIAPPSQTYALAATVTSSLPGAAIDASAAPTIHGYLSDPAHLAATLRTLPEGDAGRPDRHSQGLPTHPRAGTDALRVHRPERQWTPRTRESWIPRSTPPASGTTLQMDSGGRRIFRRAGIRAFCSSDAVPGWTPTRRS